MPSATCERNVLKCDCAFRGSGRNHLGQERVICGERKRHPVWDCKIYSCERIIWAYIMLSQSDGLFGLVFSV